MFLQTLLRPLLGVALAVPIVLAGAVQAREAAETLIGPDGGGLVVPLPSTAWHASGVVADDPAPVLLAQMVDPRIAQLEEQVRRLTGLVEELNFQILQMQDQIRRMQEDNEQRFQEIEQRRSQAPGTRQRDHARLDDGVADVDDGAGRLPAGEERPAVRGQPGRNFGTITFDRDGNFSGAGIAGTRPQPDEADNTIVAAVPSGGGADELYRNSYQFILSGDYDTAEAGFRELIARYPQGEQAADAHFWLGEALLAQQRPHEAAEVFLAASRSFPRAQKAPDTLFKLGVALAALNQRGVACATLAEVGQRFPQASGALKDRVRQEQARIAC